VATWNEWPIFFAENFDLLLVAGFRLSLYKSIFLIQAFPVENKMRL